MFTMFALVDAAKPVQRSQKSHSRTRVRVWAIGVGGMRKNGTAGCSSTSICVKIGTVGQKFFSPERDDVMGFTPPADPFLLLNRSAWSELLGKRGRMPVEHFKAYARRIRELLRVHPATNEPALAPAFQQLLTNLIPTLPAVVPLTVVPEFNNPGVGRPDIALKRQGQPARAFVELKAPTKRANPARWTDAHDRRQRERFNELANWSTSNFVDFCLLHRDELFGTVQIVPEAAIDPNVTDVRADTIIDRHDVGPFLDLLALLCRADAPAARDAEHLAELLAHSARLVRSIVQERLAELRAANIEDDPLLLVRETFRNVLYAHPEAGGYPEADFDVLFSSAFAQTLAFGLLLVREALTSRPALTEEERKVGTNAWEHMPEEHPLMRAALRVLSEPEIAGELGIGFEVMRDTVNSFAPEILAIGEDGRDPILYFYENFLETFDPKAREKYGVYYTPVQVVRYMVAALDRALRQNLGTEGLRDPAVNILDPATGTGTFLLGVAERVRDQISADHSPAEAAMSLAELAGRMYGFELLVGPYAVAHYRLHHTLRSVPVAEGEEPPQVDLPRLGIYLADTLSNPETDTPIGALGIQGLPIAEERREANRIKAQQPILGIIGNPPYRRLKRGENLTLVGQWMDEIWDDLKAPVREAGLGNQLNTFPEFSIAFWRWAIWKLFESSSAPRQGVVAFISNRKFLTGWPYAGLRKKLRQLFDEIEIIDLRGDGRTGARADIESDENVFNIRVGVCITLAVATGTKAEGELASVRYFDVWSEGLQSRRQKLGWLLAHIDEGEIPFVPIVRSELENFRPVPFPDVQGLELHECFTFKMGGVQTARDELVYDSSADRLIERLNEFKLMDTEAAKKAFKPTGRRTVANAQNQTIARTHLRSIAFRPLDTRVLYADDHFVEYMRGDLLAAWGDSNLCLYAMPFGTGAGPAVWCHGGYPDYQSFSERGGYAFPLYDRRQGPTATNVSNALITSLSAAYGGAVQHQDVFDAILALLSARSYTRRFAEDLEDVFPHVAFPAAVEVFQDAVRVGREIRAIEAFARAPAAQPQGFCRLASQPTGDVAPADYRDNEFALCADGSGRITGIPNEVWTFAVSGYRVLPRWIEGRIGLPADLALVRELRDIAARIAELIHRFDEADLVLEATLANNLTREELGFAPAQLAPVEEAVEE